MKKLSLAPLLNLPVLLRVRHNFASSVVGDQHLSPAVPTNIVDLN